MSGYWAFNEAPYGFPLFLYGQGRGLTHPAPKSACASASRPSPHRRSAILLSARIDRSISAALAVVLSSGCFLGMFVDASFTVSRGFLRCSLYHLLPNGAPKHRKAPRSSPDGRLCIDLGERRSIELPLTM